MDLETAIIARFETHGLRVVEIEQTTPLNLYRQLPPVQRLEPDKMYAAVGHSEKPRLPLARIGDEYLILSPFTMTSGRTITLDFPGLGRAMPMQEFAALIAQMELR